MKTLFIQNCAIEKLGFYEDYLRETNISLDIVQPYKELLPSFTNYDFLIIGGTPDSAYNKHNYPYLNEVFQYMVEAIKNDKPCFGICCGAQLLALVLGANVFRNNVMEIGCYNVVKTNDGVVDPLLHKFPSTFKVFQWHGDTFEIPTGANLLATSEQCTNQLFRFGKHVGVQFHLEVSAKETRIWAEKYSDELKQVGKTKNQVVDECKTHEQTQKEHAYLLMENYINLITAVG
jgi:GMP synthase (glutamine-hydrolysing)